MDSVLLFMSRCPTMICLAGISPPISSFYLSDAGIESFGMVVPESMACGTPVVALRADEGGPAEMITNGVDGLLVDEADAGEAIASLYAQPEDYPRCVTPPAGKF